MDVDDEGGDPACWLSRVCEHCGQFVEGEPPAVCGHCGHPAPAGEQAHEPADEEEARP